MERLIPLLKYLESVSLSGSLVLSGSMNSEKTALSYLKEKTKIIKVRFQAQFLSVSDIEAIDPEWVRENSIVWESVNWSSGLKEGEFIAYTIPTEVHVYLTYLKPQIKVKSSSHQILLKIEEYCHQLGILMMTI